MWSGILDSQFQPGTGLCRSKHHLLRQVCSHRPEFAQGSVHPAAPKLAPSYSLNRATPSRHRSRRLELLEPAPSRRQREGAILPASRIDSGKRYPLETLADQSVRFLVLSLSVSRINIDSKNRAVAGIYFNLMNLFVLRHDDDVVHKKTVLILQFCFGDVPALRIRRDGHRLLESYFRQSRISSLLFSFLLELDRTLYRWLILRFISQESHL